jgi:hypothetical protein
MKKKLVLLSFLAAAFSLNAQNVGIGTATPQSTLDVKGNLRTGGSSNFILYDSLSGKITWTNSNLWVTTPQYLMKHSASAEGLYSNGSQLEYRNSTGNPAFFTNWNNGNGYFSGDVGIGTATPQHKLHLFTGASGTTAPFGYNLLALESNGNINMSFLTPDANGSAIWFSKPSQLLGGGIFYNNGTPDGFLFRTNNAPRMVITNAGRVGIGLNTPGAKLHVIDNGGSGGTPFAFSRLAVEGDGHTYINMISPDASETAILFGKASNAASGVIMYNNTTTPDGFQFRNNGNLTRMVIDNAGNVGMGTIAPGAKLEITHNGASTYGTALLINQDVIGNSDGPKLQFRKTMTSTKSWSAGILNGVNVATFSINEDGGTAGFGTPRFSIIQGGNTGIGTTNPLTKLHIQNGSSGNSSPNSPVTVESNTNTYINLLSPNTSETGILFGRADNAVSGGIIYNSQGPGGTNNGFQIRVNGNQEAARIDNNGNMGVGTGSIGDRFTIGQKITNPYALTIYEINAAGNGASYWRMGIDPGTKRLYFLSNTAGTNIAYIDPNNGNWVTISDKSLKEDIVPLGHVMAKVMQLNPVSYKMLHQYNDERSYGFLAQELQQVIPDAVKQFGNSGDPKSAISYTHLIPVTIAAIQEQQQTIETLQQQVNELKKMVEQLLRK